MLINPFTPSQIASQPGDFFGRIEETQQLERAIRQGSVAICGAVGIGKSSLLAHCRLRMEGFDSDGQNSAKTIISIGNKDIRTVDEAARLILEAFVEIDEAKKSVRIKLPKVFEWESSEIVNYFKSGRHLVALKHILERESFDQMEQLLILAIDEADKCPVPLARLVRDVSTHVQHEGIMNIRFLLAGVSPFFNKMVKEDAGISRFFYKQINVLPLFESEATELLETKFKKLAKNVKSNNIQLTIDPGVITRVVQLSGGHPHLLQLLGSHLVEHEESNPDGIIDIRDLVNALRTISYEDRGRTYTEIIHSLELDGMLEPFKNLLMEAKSGLPTKIERNRAANVVEPESLEWLVANDILTVVSPEEYGLNDEFLRIRLIMDDDREKADKIEWRLIEGDIDEFGEWPLPDTWLEEENNDE
jgi:hypothetical protein